MNKPFQIDDETLAKLREKLGSDERAMSEFANQAIKEKLAREPEPAKKQSAYELSKDIAGKYEGLPPDLARNAEAYLREMFDAKRRG